MKTLFLWILASAGYCSMAEATAKQRSWLGPSKYVLGAPSARAYMGFTSLDDLLFVFGGLRGGWVGVEDAHAWTDLSAHVTGVPPSPRSSHGFSSLNGKLYVFGGSNQDSVPLNDFYHFDPSILSWTDLSTQFRGTRPTPRFGFGLASASGKLFIFGGGDNKGGTMNDFYVLDPLALHWKDLSAQGLGTRPSPRKYFGFTSADDKLYAFGGWDHASKYYNDLYRFDPSTLLWTEFSQMLGTVPSPRDILGFSSVAGILYLFGGATEEGGYFEASLPPASDYMLSFDLSTATWTDLTMQVEGQVPIARVAHGFASANSKLFLFGGNSQTENMNDLYSFDPSLLIWADLSGDFHNAPTSARGGHGVTSVDSQLYTFGGWNYGGLSNEFYKLDPSTLAWTDLSKTTQGSPPSPRYGMGFSSLSSVNRIFIFGGWNESGLLNDILSYDILSLVWTDLSHSSCGRVASPRFLHGFASHEHKLFIFGGWGTSGYLNDLFDYDLTTLCWTSLSHKETGIPPSARFGHGFTFANGNFFVFGGEDRSGVLNDLYALDPSTLLWTDLSNLTGSEFLSARSGHGFTSTNLQLFAFGGYEGYVQYVNDLQMFDCSTLEWINITKQIQGGMPSKRYNAGFIVVDRTLFLLGGMDVDDISWKITNGAHSMIEVYDWDTLTLTASAWMSLNWPLRLCTQVFPCTLSVRGDYGVVFPSQDGSITCLASLGCTGMFLDSLRFVCDWKSASLFSLLEVQGTKLHIHNTSFENCTSMAAGGVVNAYKNASVRMKSTVFKNIVSLASGGGIRVAGATLLLEFSRFDNCYSVQGAGAVSLITSICPCSEYTALYSTIISISSCIFERCSSSAAGGAISATGDQVYAHIIGSSFIECNSNSEGGAVAVNDGANMTISNSTFIRNVADGMGGGVIYLQSASLFLENLVCTGNIARNGGGGVLYSHGAVKLEISHSCGAGWFQSPSCAGAFCIPSCASCDAGTFQGSPQTSFCNFCPAGTFSSSRSATSEDICVSCLAGKYSTATGANDSEVCMLCESGSYSRDGSSHCSSCQSGKYSSITGVSSCQDCGAGTFSTEVGAVSSAACRMCQAGTYAHLYSSECVHCPAGKFSTAMQASSVNICQSCIAGTFSTVTGAVSAATCSMCRAGTFSPQKYFALEFVSLTWNEAEAACADSGGHLASIHSQEENDEILNLLASYPFDFWIGIHYDVSQEAWRWSDGTETEFEHWAAQNPKSGSLSYGCTLFPAYPFPDSSGLFNVWPYFTEVYGFLPIEGRNLSSPAGSWYNFECNNSFAWVNGFVCAFTGATVCTSCKVGEFSNTTGSTASSSCLKCPAGTYSISEGSLSCHACSLLNSSNSTFSEELECQRTGSVRMFRGRETEPEPGQKNSGTESKQQRNAKINPLHYFRPDSHADGKNDGIAQIKQRSLTKLSHQESGTKSPKQSTQTSNPKTDYIEEGSDHRKLNKTDQAVGRNLKSDSDPGLVGPWPEKFESQMCGPSNQAVYGPCVASSYDRLQVFGLPKKDAPAYPGLPFSLIVLKKDVYQQTVASDSTSLLQAKSTSSKQGSLGTFAATFQEGNAVLSIVLKPVFAVVDPSIGLTMLEDYPNLYISGQDYSYESTTMQSDVFQVIFSSNNSVCPMGYILNLDQIANTSSKVGSCSECGPGTYSVSPLAGYSHLVPSCFNCPAGAMIGGCKGGSEVLFSVGTWVVLKGIYTLVSCPLGHQLVNSVNGHFSHDIQQCLQCQSNEYIVDSNNSDFSCLKCPVGAICDGNGLKGLVNGSTWEADYTTGYYKLTSCPSGYELQNTVQDLQQCSFCPASFYCVGGSTARKACPQGSFAFPGGNTSSSCFQAVFVQFSITIPISENNFDTLQNNFRIALAATARASVDQVVVESISSTRRSHIPKNAMFCAPIAGADESAWLFSSITETKNNLIPFDVSSAIHMRGESSLARTAFKIAVQHLRASVTAVEIVSHLAAENNDKASAFMSNLNEATLNVELQAHDLPKGILNWVHLTTSNFVEGNGVSVSQVIGGSIGGFVFLCVLLAAGYHLATRIRIVAARASFLAAIRTAQVGEKASANHLPYELRNVYEAQEVVGKGAFGCVVHVKTRRGGTSAAIKFVIPEKGVFLESELRQLKREGSVLDMFSHLKCDQAVHLKGIFAVHVHSDICWFVMEYLRGENMNDVIKNDAQGPISDKECIKVGRAVLAVLKVIHADGLVHRDIKPANIMRIRHETPGLPWDGHSYTYKLVDFGTVVGVDETIAKEIMMTLASNRHMGAGTLPYMSPEMFLQPETAHYPTDLWSLGVTMFELVTARLPFEAESDLLISVSVAGDLKEKAPSVLDTLSEDRCSLFDHNLAKVIAKALEKKIDDRFQSADEMHEALYYCLIHRHEASYSAFISYRVASEAPLARLLFDELNHSVTPGGHRVTIYWDAHRLINGDNWEEGFTTGLMNSLCFFPLLSYGATAPLAELPRDRTEGMAQWDERPCGRARLTGSVEDVEDNFLKELLIATALLERNASEMSTESTEDERKGLIQRAYPVLVGRQHPEHHPEYPRMGNFFEVQAGGGKYPRRPSPATNAAVVKFLKDAVGMSGTALSCAGEKTVAACVESLTMLQGCQLWNHPTNLQPVELTREQKSLVGKGCAGPAVALGGVALSAAQQEKCRQGLDQQQLEMLKAQVRYKRSAFHEVIDRAVWAHERSAGDPSISCERKAQAPATDSEGSWSVDLPTTAADRKSVHLRADIVT